MNIIVTQTKQEVETLIQAINSVIGFSDPETWDEPRQPTKIEYNLWYFRDPRILEWLDLENEITKAMNLTGVRFTEQTKDEAWDYTEQEAQDLFTT